MLARPRRSRSGTRDRPHPVLTLQFVSDSRPLFIYDGDCGFCRKWAGWLDQRVGSAVRFSPFQALEDLARFNLTVDDVQSASYLFEEGRAYRGGRGIAQALARGNGIWKLLGLVLDLPGARQASARAYRYVARNRHRLPAPDRELTL
jgi:predicted DCC family thiol-disulfide oxidoreductase YuxK